MPPVAPATADPLVPTVHELDDTAGTEPAEEIIQRNAAIYRDRLPNARVAVIPRVGFDVAASCGMFFGPTGPDAGPARVG